MSYFLINLISQAMRHALCAMLFSIKFYGSTISIRWGPGSARALPSSRARSSAVPTVTPGTPNPVAIFTQSIAGFVSSVSSPGVRTAGSDAGTVKLHLENPVAPVRTDQSGDI